MRLHDLQTLAAKAAAFFPHCVIGGGAVRDTLLGGPVKDIDLFVDTRGLTRKQFDQKVAAFAERVGGTLKEHSAPSVDAEDLHTTYHIHWAGPVIEVLPVSRCVFTDVFDYDFGISQILMTSGGLLRTTAFVDDLLANTVTYKKDTFNAKSRDRLARIRAKYPSLAPVNCEVLA